MTMIPPLPASVLAANPAFAKVWNHLATEVLRGDASQKTESDPSMSDVDGDGDGDVDGDVDGDGDGDGDEEEEPEQQAGDDNTPMTLTPAQIRMRASGNGSSRKKRRKFEDQLHDCRVRRMKLQMMRCLLADVAYHGDWHADSQEGSGKEMGTTTTTTTATTTTTTTTKREPVATEARENVVEHHTEIAPQGNSDKNQTDSQTQPTSMSTPTKTAGELRDLLLLISAYLDVRLCSGNATATATATAGSSTNLESDAQRREAEDKDEDTEVLLADDIARLKENIPIIAELVGSRVVEIETVLGDIAAIATDDDADQTSAAPAPSPSPAATSTSTPAATSTSTSTSNLTTTTGTQGPSGTLLSYVQTQLSHISHLRTSTFPERLATVTKQLHTLLDMQRHLLRMQIQHLESSKHGILHRHAMSRLTFLTTVAQAMDLKTRVLVMETQRTMDMEEDDDDETGTGTAAAQRKNRNRIMAQQLRELDAQDAQADQRLAALDDLLAEYEAVDPGLQLMQRLGARYRDLEADMDGVRRHIETLERTLTRTRTSTLQLPA
ncbi:hypothetical protein A1O3_10162 [Capronia epimyces CBS 606.96]|uniref:Uncharacterized protein n=1 Tax=Capronia epimyces CBS 606.96 TaxID=1182542 RepID=W9XI31_9EURO|nr:uncharacterized protein A1O3_10162 [Capronia epimyces CBS 606.96]EXJ77005.1 hypothetical protein A1O3_10162 [Capronia epimyces CBS 606.96]